MKEQFRDTLEKPSIIEGMSFLDAWCPGAGNSAIKQLKTVAKTLMHHSHALLNYFFTIIFFGIIEDLYF
ncbi:MAG: transposase [Thermodesulfobacteriota bacterium]|nr:transposase [Thermodesulfobacteriota bacterium]